MKDKKLTLDDLIEIEDFYAHEYNHRALAEDSLEVVPRLISRVRELEKERDEMRGRRLDLATENVLCEVEALRGGDYRAVREAIRVRLFPHD